MAKLYEGPVRTKKVLKCRVKRRIVPRGAPEASEQLAKILLLPHPQSIPKFPPVGRVREKSALLWAIIHPVWANENTWIFSSHRRSVSGTQVNVLYELHGTIRD